jgi:rhamnulokinase
MELIEVHRFPTGPFQMAGTVRWDIERIWKEVERGLGFAAARFGNAIASVGVDTWGLDYVLLNSAGTLVEQPWNYRDSRTHGWLDRVKERASHEEIFAASGTQFMEINTLYQLLASYERDPAVLAGADTLLMIPDYLHYRMCGARVCEFTNATTTQFFHPTERRWSTGLLEKLGLPTHMLPEVVPPGTPLGPLLESVRTRTGLHPAVQVIAPATHDTGSAVAGLPGTDANGNELRAYISSGTWSLLGVELAEPNLSRNAFTRNLTNEGGLDGSYRLLKNIMGLWIVQECRRSFAALGGDEDYAALVRAAEEAPRFRSLIDPDDARFLNPDDMPTAIAAFCAETAQPIPDSKGGFIRCALESLALRYAVVFGWMEDLVGARIGTLNVVGGGARNELLNRLTAEAVGRRVVAGPVEATVLGNLLVQTRALGEIDSVAEMRHVARVSSSLLELLPEGDREWLDARERFATIKATRLAT